MDFLCQSHQTSARIGKTQFKQQSKGGSNKLPRGKFRLSKTFLQILMKILMRLKRFKLKD